MPQAAISTSSSPGPGTGTGRSTSAQGLARPVQLHRAHHARVLRLRRNRVIPPGAVPVAFRNRSITQAA